MDDCRKPSRDQPSDEEQNVSSGWDKQVTDEGGRWLLHRVPGTRDDERHAIQQEQKPGDREKVLGWKGEGRSRIWQEGVGE